MHGVVMLTLPELYFTIHYFQAQPETAVRLRGGMSRGVKAGTRQPIRTR